MNLQSAVAGPRALVKRVLVDRVDILRGDWPSVDEVDVDVPAFIRPAISATNETPSGGETVAVTRYRVRLPLGTDVRRGDTLTVTKNSDGELEGRHLTVIEPELGTEQASRVVICHQAT